MRVTLTTENDSEPQGFKDVLPPTFQNGFLVLEGRWDSYLVRSDLIREIRVIEEEDQMPLNYTAAEYRAEIAKLRTAEKDIARDANVALVVDAINRVSEYVDLPDGVEEDSVRKVLEANSFDIKRIGDRDENGNCKYRIIPNVK